MTNKFFTTTILLVALVISAGSVFGQVQIGEITVQQTTTPPSYAEINTTVIPFEADLTNSPIEDVRVDAIVLDVQGDDPASDLTHLAVSIDGIGLGSIWVSRGINVFNGNWHLDKDTVGKLGCTVFVQDGAGHEFSIELVEIQATGETYGFEIPVIGLPIGGSLIEIIPAIPDLPSFYGWITDLDGNPLEATVIAINAETKEKTKAVSNSEGFYQIPDLPHGTYWLIAWKQFYYADVSKEFLESDSIQVDFWLAPK